MRSESFNIICWVLGAMYIALGVSSLLQLSIIHIRETSTWKRLFVAKTVQQKANKVAFYSLDEFATMVFFSLTSILALFWAELYYIAIDDFTTFSEFVRPVTYLLNVAAYIVVSMCAYLVTSTYKNEVDYVYVQYSILVGVVYLIAAIIFGYFSVVAGRELSQVPIQLAARQQRMMALKILAAICISALVLRAVVILALTGRKVETYSDVSLLGMVAYYVFLELVPMLTAVIFYKVESVNEDTIDANSYETEPLYGGSGGSSHGTPLRTGTSTGTVLGDDYINNGIIANPRVIKVNLATSDDVITSIIDKLSLSSSSSRNEEGFADI